MGPISKSQRNPDFQSLLICRMISDIVVLVSALAAVTFAFSTYSIITYGAPLAAVAFVANPLLSASIACTLLVISFFAKNYAKNYEALHNKAMML